jgi:alkylation response protein AidB-like acyl-CoA dehydrogenase
VYFSFTEQQLELRNAVRTALERECTVGDLRTIADEPRADWRPAAGRSVERWHMLSELGVVGALADEDAGGLGLDMVDLVGVLEEAGRVAVPEPLAEAAAMAAPLLGAVGGDGPAAAEALRSLAGGGAVVTVGGLVVTPGGPRPSGRRTADGVEVPLVMGASRATHAVVWAPAAGSEPAVVLVEIDRGSRAGRGATVSETPSIDPTRDLGTLTWPADAPGTTVLASGEAALRAGGLLADHAACATAAQLLGLSDRMITMSAEYAKARHQFGKPIGSFQAVKHLLANARVGLEFARPAVYRAAWSIARRSPERSHDCSMAKALASDAADLSARVALQIHGAIGYTWECDLHLFMKRAWALAAAWGDARTHRSLVLDAALARRAAR